MRRPRTLPTDNQPADELAMTPSKRTMKCDSLCLGYFPFNTCCKTDRNGYTEQDILVTSMNSIGAALHYTLAMGIPLALSFWRVHQDYKDDGSLIFPQILGFASIFIWYVLTYLISSDLSDVQHNRNPEDSKEPNQMKPKGYFFKKPMLLGLGIVTCGIFGLTSSYLLIPKLSGTFPFLLTLSPNKQDNIAPPFDNPICNGTNYATASDKTIFDWTACIRDNPVYRDLKLYNKKTGVQEPWANDIGETCVDAPCSNTVSNVYSSNEACSKCLNGKGGQQCIGRACQISDNPDSFVRLGGRADDPGNYITIGKAEILVPYPTEVVVNMSSVYVWVEAAGEWVPDANPNKTAKIKFYTDAAEGKGEWMEGTYLGNDKAEVNQNWYVWWFLYGFCIITCGFHTVLLWAGLHEIECVEDSKCDFYKKDKKRPNCCPLGPCRSLTCAEPGYLYELDNGIQIYRWIEYSVTASIMFIIVLQLNRVSDLWIIITSFLMSAGYNIFGIAIDNTDNWLFVAAYWEISFAMFAAQFAVLYYNQQYTIQPFLEDSLASRDLWAQLFGFVQAVNWGIFVTYMTFPIVNLIQQIYRIKCCGQEKIRSCCGDKKGEKESKQAFESRSIRNNTYRSEVAYIWLSFTAKAILVFFVFWGVAARTN